MYGVALLASILSFGSSVIPYKEAEKLVSVTKNSAGNCRIVNTAYAIKNNSDLLLIGFKKNGKTLMNTRHVIAYDKNGSLHDESIGTNLQKNESLQEYLHKNSMFIYGKVRNINNDMKIDINSKELSFFQKLKYTYIDNLYFRVFVYSYKKFHS